MHLHRLFIDCGGLNPCFHGWCKCSFTPSQHQVVGQIVAELDPEEIFCLVLYCSTWRIFPPHLQTKTIKVMHEM